MTPHTRTSLALGLSLLLWAPVAFSVLNGGTEVTTGGLYYLAALAFSWVGTGVLAKIVQGYADAAEQVELAKRQIEELEKQAASEERRRAEDKLAEQDPGDRTD